MTVPQQRDDDDHEALSQTGIPGLDDVLRGGLTPNRIYLVDGDPGAGKTTLAIQYLLEGARRGERGLYVTLSETKAELTASARSHGWSLDGFEIREYVANEEGLSPDSQVTMYHPSEVELSETMRAILADVDRIKPARIVLDALSELRLLAQSALRYRRQILALKQFFMGRDCTVLLLDDRTGQDGDTHLHSIAHGVLSLEQLAPEYGAERRRLRVKKLRGRRYRGGYHDYAIRRGGLEVFPRLIAAEHAEPFARESLPSGVVALDALMGGGPHRGTSTLLLGPAGSGKSTVGMLYAAAAAARGERAAVFAFDETRGMVVARSEALGIPMQRLVDGGLLSVQQVDPAELAPGEFAHAVRHAVEQGGAKVVVIDSLNGYLHAMPAERFLIAQLHELLSYLNQKGVTSFLVVAQAGMFGSSMTSPVEASYLADSVVMFRYFEDGGRVRKAVSVFKKRGAAHENAIRELRIDADGVHVGEPLSKFRGVLTGVPLPDERAVTGALRKE